MKKHDFKKALPGLVIAVLCFFFVFGVAWGASSLLEMEGAHPPQDLTEGITPCPETKDEAINLLNTAIQKALTDKPALSSGESLKIAKGDDYKDTLKVDNETSGSVYDTALYLKDKISDCYEDSYQEIKADYFEGFSDTLRIPDVSPEDITDFTCTYVYYQCRQCEEKNDTFAEVCPHCGYPEPLIKKYYGEYTLTLNLPDTAHENIAGSVFEKNFHPKTESELFSFFGDNFDGFFKCENLELSYKNIKIVAKIDRMTNRINSLKYYLVADVSADAQFLGDYESIGTKNIVFSAEDNISFSFSWPGISLSAKTLSMERNKTEALVAELTCSDPTTQEVTWSSSDEKLATVDNEGYIKSNKTADGKVTITATMVFDGKTYTDSCEVYVKTSVEKLDISKRSLTMKVGDTFTLTATVSPKKATVQTVTWYSDNEAVATVDENGVITAIGDGEVNIYALSDDGYYKATCKTEVVK